MVIIVTGAVGIGKTTVCDKVIKIARSQGYSCGGIIAHKTQNEDIIIEDVQTGETRALASTSNVYQGPRTGKYFFNPEGIDFGTQAIAKGTASDILMVDELGHLELRGEGFAKVIEEIAAGKVKNCIIVIRKDLLSAFLPQLGAITSVFETTIDNRNQLPGEISKALIQAFVGAGLKPAPTNATTTGFVREGLMKNDPDTHRRRSLRLPGYDYAQPGAYFATICTHNWECLFGEVAEGQMRANVCGQAVQLVWNELPQYYHHVGLDAFVVMPNHVHMIIVLTDDNPVGAGLKPAPTNTKMTGQRRPLSEIVRAFKTFSARRLNELRGTPGVRVWQRNYYEHIIRDEDEMNHIREYIRDNPAQWGTDENNPERTTN